MRKDNEMAMPILLLIIAILLIIGVGMCFNLILNGKYEIILYIIIASILLIAIGVLILISIFYEIRIIISKVRDTEVINNLDKNLERIKKNEKKE